MSKIAVGYLTEDDSGNDFKIVRFVFDNQSEADDFVKQYNSAVNYAIDRMVEISSKIKEIKNQFVQKNMEQVKIDELEILKNSKSEANKKYIQVCKETKNNNSTEALAALNEMKYFDKLIAKEQKNVDSKISESKLNASRLFEQNRDLILATEMFVDMKELSLIETFDLTEIQILANNIESNPEFSMSLLQR